MLETLIECALLLVVANVVIVLVLWVAGPRRGRR